MARPNGRNNRARGSSYPTPGSSSRRRNRPGWTVSPSTLRTVSRLLDLGTRAASGFARSYNSVKKPGMATSRASIKKIRKKIDAGSLYLRSVPGNTAGGYLRKKWKKAPSKNLFRYGAILNMESGGVVQNSECIYVGHGIPAQEVVKGAWRAIIKQLFEQAGLQIQSIDKDAVVDSADTGTQHILRLQYFKEVEAQTQITVIINLAAGNTISQIVDGLLTGLQSSFTSNLADGDKPKFHLIRYLQQNIARPIEVEFISCIYLEHYNLFVEHTSYLKMQNITPAGNAAAVDEDRYATTNVEAVTLRGKAYKGPHWSNCFEITRKTTGAGSSSGLLANATTGLIVNTYAGLQVSGEETFAKPPPAWQLGCKKEEKVTVDPGKVMRDKIYFKTKISLNKFMGLFCDHVKTGDYIKEVEFGLAHVFALEKMIDMRLSADGDVTVGYETDYTLKINGYYKKPPTIPLTDIIP